MKSVYKDKVDLFPGNQAKSLNYFTKGFEPKDIFHGKAKPVEKQGLKTKQQKQSVGLDKFKVNHELSALPQYPFTLVKKACFFFIICANMPKIRMLK